MLNYVSSTSTDETSSNDDAPASETSRHISSRSSILCDPSSSGTTSSEQSVQGDENSVPESDIDVGFNSLGSSQDTEQRDEGDAPSAATNSSQYNEETDQEAEMSETQAVSLMQNMLNRDQLRREQRDQPLVALSSNARRHVYLLTYSQADTLNFDRQSFANIVVDAFNTVNSQQSTTLSQVEHWACSQELHADGAAHFHMAVKLVSQNRWIRVKEHIQEAHGIVLHFSQNHQLYYNAWCYVTKEDAHYIESDNHPDLTTGPPRTISATRARCATASAAASSATSGHREQRMTRAKFGNIIVRNNITELNDLQLLIHRQKALGMTSLYEFYLNNRSKLSEIITSVWEIEQAPMEYNRRQQSRIDILRDALQKECQCTPTNKWRDLAENLLENNGIPITQYTFAVRTLLTLGRSKHRNIIHVGATNCGKTFLLSPLREIYRAFENPAASTYNWIGVEEKEIIILNDFRWSPQVLPWSDMLRLLEGDEVNFPAPKNSYSRNIQLPKNKDTPVFATSGDTIQYVRANIVAAQETRMMDSRWNVFRFTHEIRAENQVELVACVKCYAKFLFEV